MYHQLTTSKVSSTLLGWDLSFHDVIIRTDLRRVHIIKLNSSNTHEKLKSNELDFSEKNFLSNRSP